MDITPGGVVAGMAEFALQGIYILEFLPMPSRKTMPEEMRMDVIFHPRLLSHPLQHPVDIEPIKLIAGKRAEKKLRLRPDLQPALNE